MLVFEILEPVLFDNRDLEKFVAGKIPILTSIGLNSYLKLIAAAGVGSKFHGNPLDWMVTSFPHPGCCVFILFRTGAADSFGSH